MLFSNKMSIVDYRPTIRTFLGVDSTDPAYRVEYSLVDAGAGVPICSIDESSLNDASLLKYDIGLHEINGLGGRGKLAKFYKMNIKVGNICFIDIPVGLGKDPERVHKLLLPYTMFNNFKITFDNDNYLS